MKGTTLHVTLYNGRLTPDGTIVFGEYPDPSHINQGSVTSEIEIGRTAERTTGCLAKLAKHHSEVCDLLTAYFHGDDAQVHYWLNLSQYDGQSLATLVGTDRFPTLNTVAMMLTWDVYIPTMD